MRNAEMMHDKPHLIQFLLWSHYKNLNSFEFIDLKLKKQNQQNQTSAVTAYRRKAVVKRHIG